MKQGRMKRCSHIITMLSLLWHQITPIYAMMQESDRSSDEIKISSHLISQASNNNNNLFKAALRSFKHLKETHPELQSLALDHPTCFISYAWGKPTHEKIVHALAEDLKDAGINVLLDIWNNKGGTSIARFAEKILDPSTDFVVLVGSKKLMEKYNGTEPSVVRLELEMISQRATWPLKTKNIIPIVIEDTHKETLPRFLWSTVSIGFQNKESYYLNCFGLLEQLYRLKHDDPKLKEIIKPLERDIFNVTDDNANEINSSVFISCDLRGMRINNSVINSLLQSNNITSLDLANNEISDKGVLVLLKHTMLTYVNLDNNNIGNEGAKALASHPNLRILSLFKNKIEDEGAEGLASNKNLKKLNLRDNFLGERGATALANNKVLTDLNLRYNTKIGSNGAKAFINNATIKLLNLRDCRVNYDGVISLAQNKFITCLNLSLNKIGDREIKALCSFTIPLTTLQLQETEVTFEGLQYLSRMTSLKFLSLKKCRNVEDRCAAALALHATITELDIREAKISDKGATALAHNAVLKNLNLHWNGIKNIGAEALAKNSTLTSLDLSDNPFTLPGAVALAFNTALFSLNISMKSTKNWTDDSKEVLRVLKEKTKIINFEY